MQPKNVSSRIPNRYMLTLDHHHLHLHLHLHPYHHLHLHLHLHLHHLYLLLVLVLVLRFIQTWEDTFCVSEVEGT